MMFSSSLYPLYLAANFKSLGLQEIGSDHFITIVGAIGAVANGISRVGWATLFDYFGFKKVYVSIVVLLIINAFTLTLISSNKVLYLIWVAVSFT